MKPVWRRKPKTLIWRCLAGPFGNRSNKHFVPEDLDNFFSSYYKLEPFGTFQVIEHLNLKLLKKYIQI